MRRPLLAVLAIAMLEGCDDSTAPSKSSSVYALARIGILQPPIGLGNEGGPPFLIADTLRLGDGRPREDGLYSDILSHITVVQDAAGTRNRFETQHGYSIGGGTLTYDSCPLGSLCMAALIYAPVRFQIVGDSLYQIVPNASPLPTGAVYGRITVR